MPEQIMQEQIVSSICPYCGVGCGINLRIEGKSLIAVEPQTSHPISQGKLCAKGWSTAYGIAPDNRLTQPLIRTVHGLETASWADALAIIKTGINDILSDYGSQALGVISSARATNEDNYAAQKFARAVLGTNNIDHCARICHSPTVAGLKQTLGSGAMTNSIADVNEADLILVFGADPTENHSIIGGQIMQAQLRGATLIVVDPRRTRLAELADHFLQLQLGSNIALVNAMLDSILTNRWQNQEFIDQRCEGFELFAKSIEGALNVAELQTGISIQDIEAVAKLYSHAANAMILYGMGVTQFVSGTNNVIALSNLALVCGQIGKPGSGVNPLRGQNNVQGACDMGCLPNVFPGYQSVSVQQYAEQTDTKKPVPKETESRQKFAKAWHCSIPKADGLTTLGMTTASLAGDFRGMILFGEDPVVTDPDQNQVRRSLKNLDLLVVAELTLTETAKLADVVLPAASFAEKDGTFTNCERRVQRIRQAIKPPGEAMGDWQWLALIAKQLGSDALNWPDSETVFDEMAALTPDYSGMSYAKIDSHHGLQWPCNKQNPQGTAILHQQDFPIGRARLLPVHPVDIDEPADDDHPLLLTTHRLHFHYGCGSMTRKSPLLERETPNGILFINPKDAKQLAIKAHDSVSVSSRRGYLETRAIISNTVPPGLVSMPYHFREAPSNQLTNTAQDPVTKMPELKACAVKVTRLPTGQIPKDIDTLRRHKTPNCLHGAGP